MEPRVPHQASHGSGDPVEKSDSQVEQYDLGHWKTQSVLIFGNIVYDRQKSPTTKDLLFLDLSNHRIIARVM